MRDFDDPREKTSAVHFDASRSYRKGWFGLLAAGWGTWLVFVLAGSSEMHGMEKILAIGGAILGLALLVFWVAWFFRRERQWAGYRKGHPLPAGKKHPFLKGFLLGGIAIVGVEVGWAVLFMPGDAWPLFFVVLFSGGFMVNLLLAALVGWMGRAWNNTRPTCMPMRPDENYETFAERLARGGV